MTLDFRIIQLSGYLCTVHIDAGMGLPALRAAIAAETGIARECQRFVHGTQELTERSCLASLACLSPGTDPIFVDLLLLQRTAEQVALRRQVEALPSRAVAEWLAGATVSVREDRDIVLSAVAKAGVALQFAAPVLQADRDVVLTAVESGRCRFALQYAAPEVRADREVVLAAVARDNHGESSCFQYAARELRAESGTVLAALRRSPRAMEFAVDDLRADHDFVLAAVAVSASALEFATDELRADRDVVLAAISRSGFALEHASGELQGDRDIVLAAVTRNTWGSGHGDALQYAVPELRADRRVALAAVACDQAALPWVADDLRADEEILQAGGLQLDRHALGICAKFHRQALAHGRTVAYKQTCLLGIAIAFQELWQDMVDLIGDTCGPR